MKKIIFIIILISVLFANTTYKASAASKTKVIYNGEVSNISNPININNRNFYPMRELVEALGGEVAWDQDTQTVAIAKQVYLKGYEGMTIYASGYFKIGEYEYAISSFRETEEGKIEEFMDSDIFDMDASPFINNGKTYLPIGYVCHVFSISVTWDEKTKTIVLSD